MAGYTDIARSTLGPALHDSSPPAAQRPVRATRRPRTGANRPATPDRHRLTSIKDGPPRPGKIRAAKDGKKTGKWQNASASS